jgi:hypothetical protein
VAPLAVTEVAAFVVAVGARAAVVLKLRIVPFVVPVAFEAATRK